ncbi:MAG: hypothetical protein IKW42_02130, partial [Alistipes sp.]|nr:hypothetical protein [Alistipes sp.]
MDSPSTDTLLVTSLDNAASVCHAGRTDGRTHRKEELLSKQESMTAVIPIALVSSIAAVMWIHP